MKTNWLAKYDREHSLRILGELAHMHALEAGPAKGPLMCLLQSIKREAGGLGTPNDRESSWLALLKYEVDYKDVRHTPESVYHAQQVLALFKKYEGLPITVDREAVAFQKFSDSEARCKAINENLPRKLRSFEMSSSVYSVIHGAMRKIAEALGDVPNLDALKPHFGPGATTATKAITASPRFKLGARLECSCELYPIAVPLLLSTEAWFTDQCYYLRTEGYRPKVDIHVVPGKLMFVPKTALTDRSIMVEPPLNSFWQLAIGDELKNRLLRVGVNLRDQSRNQLLASLAIYRGLATVDLSAASDSIARAVVKELLPMDWYDFLSRFRTGNVSYKGTIFALEKFSSMGNGFTFELETLIFWSIAHAVADYLGYHTTDVTVYGDDIILPADCVGLLKEVFTELGFVLNDNKSFIDPPFFESCGTDWYMGFDVRPYYQKQVVSAETLFTLHNFYKRRFYDRFAKKVLSFIHPSLRIYGPDGYGDGHLLGRWVAKPCGRLDGWCGYTFDTFSRKSARNTEISPGDRILPTYAIYRASQGPVFELTDTYRVNPRDDGYQVSTIIEFDIGIPVDHDVVRGDRGYKRTSIYTLARPF